MYYAVILLVAATLNSASLFELESLSHSCSSFVQVSVNEAAAQLCRRIPALLTRRDDLYPLSRRVVRDSGYQYSKGHSRCVIIR